MTTYAIFFTENNERKVKFITSRSAQTATIRFRVDHPQARDIACKIY